MKIKFTYILVLLSTFSFGQITEADSMDVEGIEAASSQTDTSDKTEKTGEVYEIYQVQKVAQFKGGEAAMYRFIGEHLEYPAMALEQGVMGRVTVQFIIEKDGSITEVKIRGNRILGFGLEEAAMNAVKKMDGKWDPALQSGKPARMRYVLPIRFHVDNEPSSPKSNTKKANKSLSKPVAAEFVGGSKALKKFIKVNTNKPIEARKNDISGRVMVAFDVEPSGKVSNVRVVSKKRLGHGCEQEALRVVKLTSRKWESAYENGKMVKTRLELPIVFK